MRRPTPEAEAAPFLNGLILNLAGLSRARRLLAAVFAGLVAGTGQAPLTVEINAILGLALGFCLLAATPGPRAAFWTGWAMGLGYFALTLFWITEPFLVDAPRHGWMAPFALALMAGGLALFWGAAFALARWLGQDFDRLALAWPLALAAAEMARGHVLTGFPWALIGYVWSDTAALQWVAIVGPYGLTLLTLLAVSGTFLAIARKSHPVWMLAGALPIAGLILTGIGLMPPPPDLEGRPVVRLVQPNAAQHLKWDPVQARIFFDRQLAFTAAPGAPALTVWPETAIPWWLDQAGPALEAIAQAAEGRPVVIGANRGQGGRAYNAMAVIGAEGRVEQVYDKHHLVPFGEYIPLGQAARLIGLQSFAARDGYGFSPGPGPALLEFGALGRALPLICYEAIFPQAVAAAPARPDFLLQITNDAWFGEISGPYQHLAQARARAVEQGLPMLRVANTGVSALIGPGGRTLASLPLGEAGYLDVALPAPLPPTPYARTGDGPIAAVLAISLLFLTLARALIRS